ncbi:transmembrane and TPR repeat-containing protein 4-like [Anoplophora glabripennis]|uniref:transmembrane and TPR repeat-containing protein 4-like n=1 Tax=Anoplophora glabripennis TaxID=217634 RepID=UPI0008737F54|nr:transmembrane and TPR repeat-containing protein 4-like [Anoplophora glabripennis]
MPFTPLRELFKNDFWGTDISLNSSHKSYRPLTILSYRWNVLYSNNKLDSFQFHATNVILYGLLCILTVPVYELFLRKSKYNSDMLDTAYYASLLFTVHPVHTEPVAGLVGRADVLSSVLFFVVILLYQKFRTAKGESVVMWYTIKVIVIGCAVLCKETAISVVGLLIVYDIYQEKKKKTSWWELLNFWPFVRYMTILLPGIVIMYYRFKIMNFEGPIFTSIDNPAAYSSSLFTRIFTYNYLYILNFLLLLWPEWLCFDWSMGCVPLIETISDARIIFVILFWGVGIYSMFVLLKNNYENETLDARIMGVTLIILPFLPASNLIFTVGFVIAERTLLLPSTGFCLLVAIGLKKLERCSERKNTCMMLYYGLLFIFAIRTIQRNLNWLTEEKLFSSALEVCPLNAKVHYNVAKIAADKDNKLLALNEYNKAIELNPNYEQAMNNLANLLREEKKFKEAEVLLRRALSIRPNFAAAWMNLGIVLTNLNESEEAEHCYKMAIMHRNKYPDCYYNLGNLYLDLKRHEEALKAWEMAVLYRPTHVAAWSNTLVLLDSMKKYDDVLELGRTALMHNPKSPALHFSLANTLGKLQQFEKAEGHFLEAINFSPQNALYYSNLGVLYHRWGKNDKAKEMYRKALQIDPDMKSTELNLKRLSIAQ